MAVRFLCWVGQKGEDDICWAEGTKAYTMPCSREGQLVAVAQCLRRQLTVGWRGDRIVLAFQNQRGDGADLRSQRCRRAQ